MLAARLTTLRPALRTLLRPKTTKAKDMVDPTTTSAWWKEWAGKTTRAFLTSAPRSSSRCSRRRTTAAGWSGPRCRRISPPRRTKAAALRARAADDAAIADAAKRAWVKPDALRSEIERMLDPPLVLPARQARRRRSPEHKLVHTKPQVHDARRRANNKSHETPAGDDYTKPEVTKPKAKPGPRPCSPAPWPPRARRAPSIVFVGASSVRGRGRWPSPPRTCRRPPRRPP